MIVSSSNARTVIPSLLIDGIWRNTTQLNMGLYTVLTDTVATNVPKCNCKAETTKQNLIGPFQGHPLSFRHENFYNRTRKCVSASRCSNHGFTNRLVRPWFGPVPVRALSGPVLVHGSLASLSILCRTLTSCLLLRALGLNSNNSLMMYFYSLHHFHVLMKFLEQLNCLGTLLKLVL